MRRYGVIALLAPMLLGSCTAAVVSPPATPTAPAAPTATSAAATATPTATDPSDPASFVPHASDISEAAPDTPTRPPRPLHQAARYVAYRVQPGDTIATISRQAQTAPTLLQRYNRLDGEPQPGRELIVPLLPESRSSLPEPTLLVVTGNTEQPWVALTFDCGGENPRTYDLLATLRAHQSRTTFFLLGNSIINDPELLHQMIADGHELANHSYSHPDFTSLTDTQIAYELRLTEQIVHELAGPDVSIRPYFRHPYGAYDKRTLRAVIAQGYMPIHWNLDVRDGVGEPKTPAYLLERITTELPPDELQGAIILAHCTSSMADALPAILDAFDARGLEVRPLTDVLGP